MADDLVAYLTERQAACHRADQHDAATLNAIAAIVQDPSDHRTLRERFGTAVLIVEAMTTLGWQRIPPGPAPEPPPADQSWLEVESLRQTGGLFGRLG